MWARAWAATSAGQVMLMRSVLMLLLAHSAIAQAASTGAAEFRHVVSGYFHAVGENRLDEAMSFYHPDSPNADGARQELVLGASAYLHRTATLDFTVIHRDDVRAVALATHLHRRIAGVKFLERLVETRYVLRRQGASWKIWSSVDRSP